jgi:RNA polymerase sigma factor (sigma-70 family)
MRPGTTSPSLLHRLADWRDDDAWREFIDRYRPLIRVWCRHMQLDADTTEELCQRIWISLAHRIASFRYDPSRKFRGWLKRFCYSRAVDLFRERRADPLRRLASQPIAASMALSDASDEEVEDFLPSRPALLQLGIQVHDLVKRQVEPRTWQAFWSITIEGFTIRETADALKMSYAATFAAHKRVVCRLRVEGNRLLQGPLDGSHP